jgi:hypothetical protein
LKIRMDKVKVMFTDRTEYKWCARCEHSIGVGDTPQEALGDLVMKLEQAGVVTISWPSGRIPEEVHK